jgi:FKBP-type peptidyl-prolyl cis-trans isomerase
MKKLLLPSLLLTPVLSAQPSPEIVARFSGAMPTGVAVSQSGRVFVNFPRWGDPVGHAVVELRDGKEVPFPNADWASYDPKRAHETLVSVQSVVVDSADRLWILDTGSIQFGPPVADGPKLMGVDLKTNQVLKVIHFPGDVVKSTTYLNDVRVDVARNLAYITDSAVKGPNAIVVVDLKSGRSWRKLDGHRSVEEESAFVPVVEGKPLYMKGQHMTVGADGIALSPDGRRLYYCALSGRRLYSVATEALADPGADAAAAVRDEGDKGGASDGLEMDAQGQLYATNYEQASIVRRNAEGMYSTLVQLDRKWWPDSLCLSDGFLYFSLNQLQRQADFQASKDRREKPYLICRMPVGQRSASLSTPALVVTPSGLKYEVLKVGQGAAAQPGRGVVVHYTGWLENGKKFDSSVDRGEPFEFPLGAGRVIAGWDEGVAGMKIGEKRKLTIPSHLGYGARGAGGGLIPPNATLIFEVELLQVK